MHVRALVIVRAFMDKYTLERLLDDLMFPHAQHFPGQPYTLPCPCTGAHWDEAAESANQTVGTFAEIGKEWLAIHPAERPEFREFPLAADWQRAAYEAAKSEPEYHDPKPFCEKCSGTGAWEVDWNASAPNYQFWTDFDERGGGPHSYPYEDLPQDMEYTVIVTPDGKWHERDLAADDPEKSWKREMIEIFKKYKDHEAVVCFLYV